MRGAAILLSFLLCACGGSAGKGTAPTGGSTQAVPPKAAKAAALSKEIRANPDDADAILERSGMTRAQFEELMYEIAADEELSKAYQDALAR